MSSYSSSDLFAPRRRWAHVAPQDRRRRTEKNETHDRMRPASGGAIGGALGGALMLATADLLMRMHGGLAERLGNLLLRGRADAPWILVAGFAMAIAAGAIVGAGFGMATRHLRKFAPLLVWAIVFFPAMWTAAHAFLLPLLAAFVRALPYGPMVAGSLVFGIAASLQLPLRARSRRR